jgi:ectoine hydroxylase
MKMSTREAAQYSEQGYVLLDSCLPLAEIARLRAEAAAACEEDSPRRVLEDSRGAVRSVYGAHTRNAVFHDLCRHPELVARAMEMVGGELYVYQFKINAKVAFAGDTWEWHQDYIFWREEDGMPAPRVVTAAIFLDDVTEFNGPMFLIPRSHQEGVISVAASNEAGPVDRAAAAGKPWLSNLTARLKYSIDREIVARLTRSHGMFAARGSAGSVLFFHANIVHASPANISPWDRRMIFITYNATDNVPISTNRPRPEFLVGRDVTPIVLVGQHA